MSELQGYRLPDTPEGKLPERLHRGAYWKVLDDTTGEPKRVLHGGKLTEECWRVAVPRREKGFAIANLDHHTVREHDDGTISVRLNDGSSNSILVSDGAGWSWHGFVEHGVLREG